MNKKRYIQPTTTVEEMELSEIIATSQGDGVSIYSSIEPEEPGETPVAGWGKQW